MSQTISISVLVGRIKSGAQAIFWIFGYSMLGLLCSYALFPEAKIDVVARILIGATLTFTIAMMLTYLSVHPAFRYFPARLRSGSAAKARKVTSAQIKAWVPTWERRLKDHETHAVQEEFRIKSANLLWVLRTIRETAEHRACDGVLRMVSEHPYFNTAACNRWLLGHSVAIVVVLAVLRRTGRIYQLATLPGLFFCLMLIGSYVFSMGPFHAQIIEERLKATARILSSARKLIMSLLGGPQ